jgi:3-hydroxyisobutyrate dehydrogenase-like beta-hydroxyacid dehydrogenase
MSDISVIGLGLMGSALARTFQIAGHELTVCNRSPATKPFSDGGVATASSIATAGGVRPVTLICID